MSVSKMKKTGKSSLSSGFSSKMGPQMAFAAVDLTAVLPDHSAIKITKKFRKKPHCKAINSVGINNVFLTKTKCLEQSKAGHLTDICFEIGSSHKELVLSLCSGRSCLFKQ